MKKQICFAGFAESEIERLCPALDRIREAWEYVFSPDGTAAAVTLGAKPFDALVANLGPGGVTDEQLAKLASARHSRTLLFVLGDISDREQTSNCIGAAHQFISRPWQPHELIPIIERSLALDSWLCTDKLRSLLPRLGQLPSLSATYFEVIKKAESPHASIESISEVIARDPALSARLLQVVNSPACGLNQRVTHPAEAVQILGMHMVKSIVLCLQMFARPAGPCCISLDQLWRHSFLVAKQAHKIVSHSTGGERMAGDAYSAGLLHRVGQIVLANNLSSEYAAVVAAAQEQKRLIHEVEMEKLGVTHNQVGAYLLGVWGLPLPLVEAVAFYPTPGKSATVEFSLLTAVHVGNVLAQEEENCDNGLPKPKLDGEYLAKLDLPAKTSVWRKALSHAPTPPPERDTSREERPAPARAREKPSRPVGKYFAFGFAAVAVAGIVAVVLFRPQTVPASIRQMASQSKPAEETPASAPAAAPATASPFESIKLQGIFYHADHPTALINGKMMDKGASVNGAEVVTIEPTQVILAYMGEQKIFKLKSN